MEEAVAVYLDVARLALLFYSVLMVWVGLKLASVAVLLVVLLVVRLGQLMVLVWLVLEMLWVVAVVEFWKHLLLGMLLLYQ